MSKLKYCPSIHSTKRLKTREVIIGSLPLGGNNPIRIQSMTTSSTQNVQETVDQIIRLSDLGCDLVRVTVQGIKEARACEQIKNSLLKKGYTLPIIADIHFFPAAALTVVDFVDKIRINPGNYVDKRASFKEIEYNNSTYQAELQKIEDKFTPLVIKCKKLNKVMRIGANHGSLSDRIMNRYGDTSHGMLESALEYATICRKNDFHDFLFSMKASNTQVMIQAYRLLASKMIELGWDYPIHLGVTEAGEGEDGRIKSAIGIGSLLLDGIGDTIRVSLTEDPWHEILPCKQIISLAGTYHKKKGIPFYKEENRNITEYKKRNVTLPSYLNSNGSVGVTLSEHDLISENIFKTLRCVNVDEQWKKTEHSVDFVILKASLRSVEAKVVLKSLKSIGFQVFSTYPDPSLTPIYTLTEAQSKLNPSAAKFSISGFSSTPSPFGLLLQEVEVKQWELLKTLNPALILIQFNDEPFHYTRKFFNWLQKEMLTTPILFSFKHSIPWEEYLIQISAEYGSFFCEGLGNGIVLSSPAPLEKQVALSFDILQGTRQRLSKTEFISCPSCGRTLFNLQEVSERIRQKTIHLAGVKIAIMGCIVNGPGEMADADFGYVGSKVGKVDLYVEKECVERNIDFADADNKLIELIKLHGKWSDPSFPSIKEKPNPILR